VSKPVRNTRCAEGEQLLQRDEHHEEERDPDGGAAEHEREHTAAAKVRTVTLRLVDHSRPRR
jgi:hypothetical protein